MFFHEFGKHLVLALYLRLKKNNACLGLALLNATVALKCGGAMLKEFLLSAVENRRLQVMLPTYLGY